MNRVAVQVTLAEQEIILKEKNKAAEALIEVVGAESEKVSKEKAFGNVSELQSNNNSWFLPFSTAKPTHKAITFFAETGEC